MMKAATIFITAMMIFSCSKNKFPSLQGDWYSMIIDQNGKKHTGQLYLKFTGINESGNHFYEGLSSTSQSNWLCEFNKIILQCTYKKSNKYGKIILKYSDTKKDLTGKWTFNNKVEGYYKAIKNENKGGA